MTPLRTLLLGFLMAGALAAPAALAADKPDWLTRCNLLLGDESYPESAHYLFETLGKEEGAQGRAAFDYSASGSAGATVYPTEAKDLMNPYGGASLGVTYYGLVASQAPYGMVPKVGRVSVGAIAKDFEPLPGKVTVKLVIDDTVFGPYEPKASSAANGQYSIWLDTADLDGDSAPPLLKPAQFAKLAKAVDAMKTAQVVIVEDGRDVALMPVPLSRFAEWRGGLAQWAAETRPGIRSFTGCRAGGNTVN